MGYGNEVRIQLRRSDPSVPWGFRLQGGKEFSSPLSVQRVFNGSPSDGQLQRGDVILSVDNRDVRNTAQGQVQDFIQNSSLVLSLLVDRSASANDESYVPQSSSVAYGQQYAPAQPSSTAYAQSPWKHQPTNQQTSPPYAGQYHQFSSAPAHGGSGNFDPAYDDGLSTSRSNTATFTPSQKFSIPPQSYPSPPLAHSAQNYPKHSPTDQWGGYSQVGDEDFEHKTVGNIRGMFDKSEEVGGVESSQIKRAHPRAPMHRAGDSSSFATPQYGPTPSGPKSSLTPTRTGSIQRGGAAGTHSHSYIPPPPPDTSGGSKRTPGLYGYDQATSTGGGSKYVGGFVGINELLKSKGPTVSPVKKPPGQKKKDFDPSQSSVLRILQEEEERRGRGDQRREENGYKDFSQEPEQYRGQGQGRGHQVQPSRGKVSTGQQWQQRQQQQHQQPRGGGSVKIGGSLQALLEHDQKMNPQEDPQVQHNPQLAPSAAPTQSEYRRPGTTYKPAAQAKVKAAQAVDDYPLPEKYTNYGTGGTSDYYTSTGTGGTQDYYTSTGTWNQPQSTGDYYGAKSPQQGGNQYQSTYYPQGGSFQSTYPGTKYSASQQQVPRQFPQSYPSSRSGGYAQYPGSDYGMSGIPACDF